MCDKDVNFSTLIERVLKQRHIQKNIRASRVTSFILAFHLSSDMAFVILMAQRSCD